MIQIRTLIYDKLCFRAHPQMGRKYVVLSPTLGTLYVLGLGTKDFLLASIIESPTPTQVTTAITTMQVTQLYSVLCGFGVLSSPALLVSLAVASSSAPTSTSFTACLLPITVALTLLRTQSVRKVKDP